jgi:hypothetical protein
MIFEKTPSGTRGARVPRLPSFLSRFMERAMIRQHRRKGDRFQGLDVTDRVLPVIRLTPAV